MRISLTIEAAIMNKPLRSRDLLAAWPTAAARMEAALTAITAASDLATVADLTRAAARELTGADGVTFVLRDRGQCYYYDEMAIAPLWKGKRFPLDACVSGWVMTQARSAAIADVFDDLRVPTAAYRTTFVKSLAMVPVGSPTPVAAIGAYWAIRHIASPVELGVLEMLAESVAAALNAIPPHSSTEN